jgi:hypothetical protein
MTSAPPPPDGAAAPVAPPETTPSGPTPARPSPLSGGRVVGSGLICGLAALAIALFLRAVVANTPTRLSPSALFWSTVLIGGSGVVAGMALEAVRQLQAANPDPAYRRRRGP